jgi:membrane-associated PAP2 superfamily phosphatase
MSLFDEIVSLSLLPIIGLPYINFLFAYDKRWLYIIISGIISNGIHYLIKKISLNYKYNFLFRPKGAYNCDLLSRNGDQSGKPGFPSGHVTSIVTFFTGISLLFPEYRKYSIPIGIVYTLLMTISRINKKCHSISQTIAGSLLGLTVPTIIYIFIKK